MDRYVVLGRGPVGRTVARQLVAEGHDVVVLSRAGGPLRSRTPLPDGPGRLRTARVDATDADALARAADGAIALLACAAPPYHRWPTDWPPLHEATLAAVERTGAVLVTAGNLYPYGRSTGPMTETTPEAPAEPKGRVRAACWAEARRRHEAGRLRATEVRAADYLGPEADDQTHVGTRMLHPLLAGRTLHPVGDPDVPHSWTYLPDLARALVAAARTPDAWGHVWHAPSPAPLPWREVARRFAAAAGLSEPVVRPVPVGLLRAVGLVHPFLREVATVGYQLTAPFVMDATRSAHVLGVRATPWDEVVAQTLTAVCEGAGGGLSRR